MNSNTPTTTIQYEGQVGELFALIIKNFIFTVLTFGIYYFWGLTQERRYIWGHLKFGSDRFEYTGKPEDLFWGAIKFIALYLGGTLLVFLTSWIPIINILVPAAFSIFVFAIVPAAIYFARNYRLRNTRLRGYRMSMNREFKSFVFEFWIDALLLLVTFGLYFPWFHNNVYGSLVNRTLWGGQSFYYTGKTKDLLMFYILGFALAPFTAGLSLLYFYGKVREYRAQHTFFQGKPFQLGLNGWDLVIIGLCYTTIIPATLFIAEPIVRKWRPH